MFAVQVVVAIGTVLATVLVAGGRGDGLSPVDESRRRTPLPADRALAASDLEAVRLGVGLRGYRMDEVDDLLDRLGIELAERDERIAELERMRTVASLSHDGHSIVRQSTVRQSTADPATVDPVPLDRSTAGQSTLEPTQPGGSDG